MPDHHLALPYVSSSDDRRVMPRLVVGMEFFAAQARMVTVYPILDSGAELSVIDGSHAVRAGLSAADIVERALDVVPIYGIGHGPSITGYLHEVTCYVGTTSQFGELRLRVLITPPDSMRDSVLGRDDFFRQVDVTFVEAETTIYLRFRDGGVIQGYE